ncbi:MAG: response regulator [Nitrospirota bacterium]
MQKILVADDEEDIRLIIKFALEDKGYKVITASDGAEAVAIADKEKIDLIILDAAMPKMDGYEACKKLKKNAKTKDIPVIFLTAIDLQKDKLKSQRVGALKFIAKPFEIEALLEEIASILNNIGSGGRI